MDHEEPAKKRRRKSSGKVKKAEKEAARASEAAADALKETKEPSAPLKPISPELPALNGASASTSSGPAKDATAAFAELHRPQKPSAKAKAGQGRQYTVSVALPGSILLNAQTWELKAALVGQIARACAIYSVEEIVVFEEPVHKPPTTGSAAHVRGKYRKTEEEEEGEEEYEPCRFMARMLEYLECPQYLRRSLFPMHPDLRLAGLLPPLDLPHHLRREDESRWREGVVLPPAQAAAYPSKGKKKRQGGAAVWCDIGLQEPIEVEVEQGQEGIPDWTRVTIELPKNEKRMPRFVSPRKPTDSAGLFWGWNVRLATSISKVLSESPYAADGGYDLSIGTSERGTDIAEAAQEMGPFKHMLLVLGGLAGLELTIAADTDLDPPLQADEASLLFDHWVNVLPNQGSRTVRTEEALLVSLAALRGVVVGNGQASS